jgi:hypothetical protein
MRLLFDQNISHRLVKQIIEVVLRKYYSKIVDFYIDEDLACLEIIQKF